MEEVLQARIREIEAEIEEQRHYLEFAATTDEDYAMAQARIAGLRAEAAALRDEVL